MKSNGVVKHVEPASASESSEEIELVRGSGNVFADFGVINADAEQLRSLLAAHILQALASRQLSVRQAEALTGVTAADLSRIRHANLARFTIDRLLTILNRLDWPLAISVQSHPQPVALA